MSITKEKVMEALSQVYDLEIGFDIVSLGLIYAVEVEDSDVRIKMTMTTPMCPLAGLMLEDARRKVSEIEGIKDVKMELTFDPPWTPEMASDDVRKILGL
ncbi:putative metal-sulfur cluster biosynthetic enzyme [Mesotoga infera]|uniref:Putative metal-sulfur cluster biosynthetic enzyme n=1 Tax=Mesotoga infera TaxID=1236046 RepID=A0A7Z7LET8_9BACT|nr:metal-sulfur cluster assembly factor [Mesotoga infera]NLI07050.1 metal-sulfur cluster assembly factor [Thermotogaceae bacterium]SSC12040.1 putative metal-sulfur cluster biosynthetic enzyme [Mesotoga infera]